ncbi:MAG: Hsp20/alpha crystallin family protein [Chlamydiia bacterium]|nr:Hsp20/alpha crystallin family protein [Chlamydiia bacterium]
MVTKKFPLGSFNVDEEDFTLVPHASGLSVYEEEDCVVIEAAVPGLSPEDISVTHAHGYLLIEGEKKEEEKKRKYYRKARCSFSYRVPIPVNALLSEDPKALYRDGIMKIIFKKGKAKAKQTSA